MPSFPSRHPALVASVAYLLGLVATAAGAGLALPHLAKTGIGLSTVVGLVGLFAGFVLAGLGAVRFVRRTPGWSRLPVVVAMVVVAYTVNSAVGVAVAATTVPPTEVGATTPADLGLPFEEVDVPTADGVLLSGWYLPSGNRAAVVLLHGSGSTRSDVLDQAVVLARRGYGVLALDARGHGRSGGRAMDLGWFGDLDVSAGVSFLAARSEVDPGRIGAVGLSMGGEEAIGALATDPRIRAVVAEGATGRMHADDAWLVEVYGARGRFQQAIEWLTDLATDVLTPATPPTPLREAVGRATPRRVLLITAGTVEEESHAARFIASGSASTVAIWTVEGAGHTGGLAADPSGWEERVTGFLDAALTG